MPEANQPGYSKCRHRQELQELLTKRNIEVHKLKCILEQVKAALSTDAEEGHIVEVARDAHAAELKLASLQRHAYNYDWNRIKDYFGMPRGGT